MNDRRLLLVLLMLGWAMAMILWNIIDERERLAACVEHPSVETCGKGSTFKPASQ